MVIRKSSEEPVESVQDFLIKLDMKPRMHLVEISIFKREKASARASSDRFLPMIKPNIFSYPK